MLQLLQVEVQPVVAVETFGIGTLLGGLTGIPLGIGVAGSTMIVLLQANNVELEVAILAIAIFRAGTVWYALGIGILAFLRYKDYVIQLFGIRQEPDHFDRIAPGYDQNIPQHLVDRLLVRKTEVMRDWLSAAVTQEDWTGLDIGCGQGWYASEMAGHGYSMTACDLSFGQTEQAGRYISQQGELVRLCVADASFLPYESGSFDFGLWSKPDASPSARWFTSEGYIRNCAHSQAWRIVLPARNQHSESLISVLYGIHLSPLERY